MLIDKDDYHHNESDHICDNIELWQDIFSQKGLITRCIVKITQTEAYGKLIEFEAAGKTYNMWKLSPN